MGKAILFKLFNGCQRQKSFQIFKTWERGKTETDRYMHLNLIRVKHRDG